MHFLGVRALLPNAKCTQNQRRFICMIISVEWMDRTIINAFIQRQFVFCFKLRISRNSNSSSSRLKRLPTLTGERSHVHKLRLLNGRTVSTEALASLNRINCWEENEPTLLREENPCRSVAALPLNSNFRWNKNMQIQPNEKHVKSRPHLFIYFCRWPYIRRCPSAWCQSVQLHRIRWPMEKIIDIRLWLPAACR